LVNQHIPEDFLKIGQLKIKAIVAKIILTICNLRRISFMTRKNKILVPEARQALDQLKAKVSGTDDPNQAKFEVAQEQNVPLQRGYNGKLTSEQAGKVGGNIGGNMVKELVRMAQENLNKN
jgi:small acid-soluble spore protein D (minor alpha/beta-type SASP)